MTSLGEDEKTPVDQIARNPLHEHLVRTLANLVVELDDLRVTLVIHRDKVRDRHDPLSALAADDVAKGLRRAQEAVGTVAGEYERIRDGE